MSDKRRVATEYLCTGDYLPKFMRDFHDQKLVFKYIDHVLHNAKLNAKKKDDRIGATSLGGLPDFVAAHTYTIDFFLWVMARHGYVLQKSRKDLEFEDIEEKLLEFEKWQRKQVFKAIVERRAG